MEEMAHEKVSPHTPSLYYLNFKHLEIHLLKTQTNTQTHIHFHEPNFSVSALTSGKATWPSTEELAKVAIYNTTYWYRLGRARQRAPDWSIHSRPPALNGENQSASLS